MPGARGTPPGLGQVAEHRHRAVGEGDRGRLHPGVVRRHVGSRAPRRREWTGRGFGHFLAGDGEAEGLGQGGPQRGASGVHRKPPQGLSPGEASGPVLLHPLFQEVSLQIRHHPSLLRLGFCLAPGR